jgi:hypothetical protein
MSGLERDDLTRRFLNLHPDTPIDMTEYVLPLLMVRQLVEATAAAEREACAKVCDVRSHREDDMGAILARLIRARGNNAA